MSRGIRVMVVQDIDRLLSGWAPKDIAWERDNIGLQVGNPKAPVARILVCLDCTIPVVREAIRLKANLIISHHPLLFRPPKSITPRDETGATIQELVRNGINLYSAHTNLDFTRNGTSFALAEAIGLHKIDFLHKTYTLQRKIVTFVPEHAVADIRRAMAEAGAGIIGNYEHCSFTSQGSGSFKGNESSRPAVGANKKLEIVPEVRLEMIADRRTVPSVIAAMKAAHPYEEPAFDVYPLENIHQEYGYGIIGTLPRPQRVPAFLRNVKRGLKAGSLRHTTPLTTYIQRVAACGGSGAELIDAAIAAGAEAFITADVKYHDFHHAAGKILLIDAGHYETENPVVGTVVKFLKQELKRRGSGISVSATRVSTNPIHYI